MTGSIRSRRAASPRTTREPRGELAGLAPAGTPGRAFRIRHHPTPPYVWELHLQGAAGRDLVLSLPRGLPWSEGERRAATRPRDAGAQAPIWDEGRYHTERASEETLALRLEGKRIRGRYEIETKEGRWSLRRLDPATVKPFPDRIRPMLAHAAPYPVHDEAYAFELKWDGVRAIAYVEEGRLTLRSRNLHDITAQYPEIEPLAQALEGRAVVLDGEIVAPDQQGLPSFQRLQERLGVSDRRLAAKRSEETPVVYIVFDILHLDGHDTMRLPYEERRALLDELPLRGPAWRLSPTRTGDGRALLTPGWEGIVAKRLGSVYEPGARSRAWIKIKLQRRQELVIGGWSAGRGGRAGRIGALLVGHYDKDGDKLRYAGSVGTGFSGATLAELGERMRPLARETSPFADEVAKAGVTFVEPRLVAEIEFTEWTREGRLRHPSYKGLREDKDPREVVREEV